MAFRSRVAALLRNLFRGGATERELDDELRAYVDMVVDDKRRSGLTPEQARRSALAELQGLEQVKERVRAVRAGALLAQVWRDVGYGLRIARRNPGFTLAAILTLALGIGAATATFTIVLNSQPAGQATIGVTSSDTTEGTVSPASVTFTAGN